MIQSSITRVGRPEVAALLLTALLLFAGCRSQPSRGPSPGLSRLTIFYSGSLNGNLAGCSCWGYPIAGLDKKAFFLKNRVREPGTEEAVLLLDTGNLFEAGEDPLQADLLMESSLELGYALFAIGEQDFSNGADRLAGYTGSFPFRSHNIAILPESGTGDAKPLYSPEKDPIIFIYDDSFVEIISLTDPVQFAPYPPSFHRRLHLEEPESVLKKLWSGKSCHPRILLLNGGLEEARRLYGAADMDILIFSPSEEPFFEIMANGGILASAGLDGNSIGELSVTISGGNVSSISNRLHHFDFLSSPSDPIIAARAEEYLRTLRSRIESTAD